MDRTVLLVLLCLQVVLLVTAVTPSTTEPPPLAEEQHRQTELSRPQDCVWRFGRCVIRNLPKSANPQKRKPKSRPGHRSTIML